MIRLGLILIIIGYAVSLKISKRTLTTTLDKPTICYSNPILVFIINVLGMASAVGGLVLVFLSKDYYIGFIVISVFVLSYIINIIKVKRLKKLIESYGKQNPLGKKEGGLKKISVVEKEIKNKTD